MKKVVRIENRIVSIGGDDGSLEEFDIAYFNYDPKVGDRVQIYRNENNVVISKDASVDSITLNFSSDLSTHVVNKIIYVLFAFFFGTFGAQEFYAGHKKAGLYSVVFCWTGIPTLYGVYKAIVALSKQEDEFGNIVM
ncbi:MAG: NINE protein [Erysipelotrichaceae bacterium]|nr:NINE protein [Erysipelotrichaceae bacterium]MDY6035721.1 NINE protein [Bulleidia sp.]